MKVPRKKVMSDNSCNNRNNSCNKSLITFFLGIFMRRDLDIRNHREKLDQKSAETKQNSKKNFGLGLGLGLGLGFLCSFMRRDLDIRNQREKLDQKSAETKQNSKKNFGRKNFWPNFD